MKWHTELPPKDTPILGCFKAINNGFNYYVCFRDTEAENEYKDIRLYDAYGDIYGFWSIEELIAWADLNELKNDMLNQVPQFDF